MCVCARDLNVSLSLRKENPPLTAVMFDVPHAWWLLLPVNFWLMHVHACVYQWNRRLFIQWDIADIWNIIDQDWFGVSGLFYRSFLQFIKTRKIDRLWVKTSYNSKNGHRKIFLVFFFFKLIIIRSPKKKSISQITTQYPTGYIIANTIKKKYIISFKFPRKVPLILPALKNTKHP